MKVGNLDKAAISEFTDLRWITIEDPKQHYPF
jgi:hypothetical protein